MNRRKSHPLGGLLFSAGMIVFALCAHRAEWYWLRIGGAVLAAVGLSLGIAKAQSPSSLFGLNRVPRKRLCNLAGCIAFGCLLGVLYRWVRGEAIVPERIGWFVLVAAAIGAAEELCYRGFVQSCLRRWGVVVAVLGAAAAHTFYKASLFVLPDVAVSADLVWLAAGTFVVGAIFGILRQKCGSVAFPLFAHVAFDVIAYADVSAVPWWVS